MSNQPHSSYPDPWAQARRIAEEWEAAGRDGADRPTQIARVKAARARRAAALSEARIKAAVDKAVREALASPEVAETISDRFAASAEVYNDPHLAPAKPLHTMTNEEWHEHGKTYWESHQPAPYRPLTIGELTAGRYDGDEA
ncbi:hypothetical protein ACIQVK_21430 [Streptomyces sp. NPDC090493]|uniref:hypothetical protein n=1 Tax=Streptomyces sp. NPDC090493 TaxID=3365964 RepID=UPI003822A105